ncbi:MAG: hypothetical protein PHR22_03845 [Candidatus Omnitrophica bacterium]|nr:hypothetical protein [Candidatus Omnitrophota bacterium]
MKKIAFVAALILCLCPSVYPQILNKTTGAVKPVRKLVVYDDSKAGAYSPSGWMGDLGSVQVDASSAVKPRSGRYCMRWKYDTTKKGKEGWAGVYWQYPANNWGTKKGMDLTGYKKLSFWIRGEAGGEVIDVKVGGITGDFPDTCSKELKGLRLSKDWKQYTVDLSGCDLSNVIGGFCWAADSNKNSGIVTFYLDGIIYE